MSRVSYSFENATWIRRRDRKDTMTMKCLHEMGSEYYYCLNLDKLPLLEDKQFLFSSMGN